MCSRAGACPAARESAALMLLSQSGVRIVGIAYKDQPDNTRRFLGQEGDPYQAVAPTFQAAPASTSASTAYRRPMW